MTPSDLYSLIFTAALPLPDVAATAGRTLHYVVGFHTGVTGTHVAVERLPQPSTVGSREIAEFGQGKLAGQRERRRLEEAADTEIVVRVPAVTEGD